MRENYLPNKVIVCQRVWFGIICFQNSLGEHKFQRFFRELLPLENYFLISPPHRCSPCCLEVLPSMGHLEWPSRDRTWPVFLSRTLGIWRVLKSWVMGMGYQGHEISKSPVVLLCSACLCRGLCGDFPVSIPFVVLILQAVALCFWVEKTQCPWWPPRYDICFPTTRDICLGFICLFIDGGGGVLFCFILFYFVLQRYLTGLILAAGTGYLQMKQALTILSHLFTCFCFYLSLLFGYLWC